HHMSLMCPAYGARARTSNLTEALLRCLERLAAELVLRCSRWCKGLSTADLVFGGCLLLGGGLLLLTLIFDDLFGGFLNAIHFGLDLGGVSPTPVLLGFVAMFGVGGLLGIHGFGVGVGLATLIGVVAGVIG